MAQRIDDKRRSNAATVDGDAADAVVGESILGGVLEACSAADRAHQRNYEGGARRAPATSRLQTPPINHAQTPTGHESEPQ